jgi:hypothetical protein
LPQSSHFIAIFTPDWEITLGRSTESIREPPAPEIGRRPARRNPGIARNRATRLDPAPPVPENEFTPVGV